MGPEVSAQLCESSRRPIPIYTDIRFHEDNPFNYNSASTSNPEKKALSRDVRRDNLFFSAFWSWLK